MNATQSPDFSALPVPTREQAYQQALTSLAHALRPNEQIWLAEQSYDEAQTVWQINIVRQGGMGRWVYQRYRYDAQSETIYFRGEHTMSGEELQAARQTSQPFDIAAWQK